MSEQITFVHDNHFEEVLKSMNEDRKQNKFCDVKIQVGDNILAAHKSVLRAESEYFRIMFDSQFVESRMDVLDLSPIFTDVEELEQILSYIYTGSLPIDGSNLIRIGRLASFFMMKNLRSAVENLLKDTVDHRICLKTLFLAQDAGFKSLERLSLEILKARFHDSVVFDSDMLETHPDLMMDFFKQGLFCFCSKSVILDLMVRWVGENCDQKYMLVADKIITNVMTNADDYKGGVEIANKKIKCHCDAMAEQVKMKGFDVNNNSVAAKFLKNVELFLASLINIKRKAKSRGKSKLESVLVTVSCLKKLSADTKVDTYESDEDQDSDDEFLSLDALDLCLYHPVSGRWYRYKTIQVKDMLMDNEDFLEWRKNPQCFMFGNKFILFNSSVENLYIFNNLDKTGSPSEILDTSYEFPTGSYNNNQTQRASFVTVTDKSVYMINCYTDDSCVSDSDDDFDEDFDEDRFDGLTQKMFFTINILTKSKEFEPICETELVRLSGEINKSNDVHIKVSRKTNEMMIVHTTDLSTYSSQCTIVYLIQLNQNPPTSHKLFYTKDPEKVLCDIHIVELDNCFLFVQFEKGKLKVLCRYTFGSLILDHNPDFSTGVLLNQLESERVQNLVIPGEECLWQFNIAPKLSLLSRMLFSGKSVTVEKHVPPPVADIITACEMKVTSNFLKKLKPISQYLDCQ